MDEDYFSSDYDSDYYDEYSDDEYVDDEIEKLHKDYEGIIYDIKIYVDYHALNICEKLTVVDIIDFLDDNETTIE